LTIPISIPIVSTSSKIVHKDIFAEEVAMLEVTKSATDKIDEYFNGKEAKPIRIFLNSGG
jgi:hypothetical protein